MLRTASRALPRRAWRLPAPAPTSTHGGSPQASFRRQITTAPPHQLSRSWKNSAARWGIALVGIYWYNTTNVFAEEPPAHLAQRLVDNDTSDLPTLDSLSPSARRRRELEEAQDAAIPSAASTATANARVAAAAVEEPTAAPPPSGEGGIEGLEEEAHSEGAFNPETGEINWDCPCLGGMAHGPCGPEFREAFSCFVFSTEEPKGMDCIDRFKNMQNCFRQHPEEYGAELEGDEDDDEFADDAPAVVGIGHEDAGIAAAPPEDAPHVAALAEKIKEKDRDGDGGSTARASPVPSGSGGGGSGGGEDARVSAKSLPATHNAARARETRDNAAPAASRTLKEPHVETPRADDEAADEFIVPRAAHDARDAPVPKTDGK